MGIFSSKDVYSPKYTTADIQSTDRVWFVPIKYLIGDLFITALDGLLYCFQMDGTRIKTYRHLGIRSFRKIYYTIAHNHPISAEKVKELEIILSKNSLPNVSNNLFNVFKNLKNKEKHLKKDESFTPHVISKMIEEIEASPNKNPEIAANLKQFCENLGTEEIVTPVKQITEFLEHDFKATNPQYMGNVMNAANMNDKMRKKITNMPETGKTPWLKMMAILMLIGIVGGLAYYAYSSGAFSHMIPQIGAPAGPSAGDLMKQYPDPYALKLKIDSGQAKLSDYPPEVQDLIKNAKPSQLPTTPLAPNQH